MKPILYFAGIFSCLIFTFSPSFSFVQQNDSIRIGKTIENYILGWRKADTTLLKRAFDLEAGVILWVDKNGESEKLKSMRLSELIRNVKRHEGYGIGYKIQSLNIIDSQLAVALVKVPRGESHYINCFELQKINGNWKIVLKSFVYFRKE